MAVVNTTGVQCFSKILDVFQALLAKRKPGSMHSLHVEGTMDIHQPADIGDDMPFIVTRILPPLPRPIWAF
eukprot:133229-Amphidinium_carterae.1